MVGRIGCDSIGKLNAKSVILEELLNVSTGRNVLLELSEAKQYYFFPGQVRSA